MIKIHKKTLTTLVLLVLISVMIAVFAGYNQDNLSVYHNEEWISGEIDRTLEIYNEEDFLNFANTVNAGNDYANWKIMICNDLDFSAYRDLQPIGTVLFMGTLEGNGHKLSNIHINNPEGNAGLFSHLGGTVKNLRIEDSSFVGNICGAIAAETYESDILNCYVDAKTEGEIVGGIVGHLIGDLYNCVSSSQFVGEHQYGVVDHCYLIGQEDIEELNQNLYNISGIYQDVDLCCWQENSECVLGREKMELLKSLSGRIAIGDREIVIQGYYSRENGEWYVTLPATLGEKEVYFEALTSKGDIESFKRNEGEDKIIYTCGQYYYPINFISADNIDTIYITLQNHRNLRYVHANKREEIPGLMMIMKADGTISYENIKGFYGHGNDSWLSDKKSYNLKFDTDIDLLNIGANEDYALLAGYRKNSLMSYCTTAELAQKIGFKYPLDYKITNLYVNGEYVGIYYLTEKFEIDTNCIEIPNLYETTKKVNKVPLDTFEHKIFNNEETGESRHYYNVENNPEDITGGYLLEMDVADYDDADSRFTTKGGKSKVTLKRARYSSEEQVNYIADFWQDFESALFSETGYNEKGKRYTEYIDLESFVMQWLLYEVELDDSLRSSIYYYKESSVTGDGLLHACPPWDMERAYAKMSQVETFWNVDVQGGYWGAFYRHEDFRKEVSKVWKERFVPAITLMIADEPNNMSNGFRNLSWYERELEEIDSLEIIRWGISPIDKCTYIKELLSRRMEFLNTVLE